MSRKLLVQFFTTPASASCCDTPGDKTKLHPNEVIMQRVSSIQQHLADRADVEVEGYATNAAVFAAIEKLNAINEKTVVSPANFYSYIASVTPMVVIDGRIAFTRDLPSWEQLRAAIEACGAGARSRPI
jgi:hypothetical protein